MSLVRAFVSFMFATPESIGFDSNIRRIEPSPRDGHHFISYVYRLTIDVGEERVHYYRTRRAISDSHRLCITGRASRVWEVEQVKSFDDLQRVDDKVVVLREVWLDESAPTERQIQQKLFTNLDSFGDKLREDPTYSPPQFSAFDDDMKAEVRALFEEDNSFPSHGTTGNAHRKVYERYFLTIREDCVGPATRGVAKHFELGSMLLREMKGLKPTKFTTVYGADPTRNTQNPTAVRPEHTPIAASQPRRKYCRKRPERLIYEENCLALDDDGVLSLEDMFIGLRGCFTGG